MISDDPLTNWRERANSLDAASVALYEYPQHTTKRWRVQLRLPRLFENHLFSEHENQRIAAKWIQSVAEVREEGFLERGGPHSV
jgi:hypothetical protein